MTPTRERIVTATAELFGRQGYNGTGLKQIVAMAQAPFGSLYHFFPGGKEQLGAEVVRWSGAVYAQLLAAIFDPAPDVPSAIEDFFTGAAAHLQETDYADACPIATVALEVASTSDTLRKATADVFGSWIAELTERFAAAGIEPATARHLAVNALGALEGAFMLSRAMRSVEPVVLAGAATRAAVEAALPAARRGGDGRARPRPGRGAARNRRG